VQLSEIIYYNSPQLIQTILLNVKACQLYRERYGKKFWRMYRAFEENQWLSVEEITEWQSLRLRKLVKHAYQTVPYYQEVFKKNKLVPNDIQSLDDLYKIPILTKDDIKQNFKQLLSAEVPRRLVRLGHTSGTTGSPLQVAYDINTCVAHHAADWRQKNWAGLEYGQPYASLQGRLIVPLSQKKPPFWRKNYINNQLFLSSFHLTEANLPYYFEKLEKDKIQYLEGYPSNIYILALYLNKINAIFPLKAILTSSETLFAFQRQVIEKAFNCKIFDFYGMAERVVFATECDQHQGHHLNLDYGITEFLDNDNQPVSCGELGHIVATSLHNFAMPLLRYKTNDSCALMHDSCSCGRAFPLMDSVATKNESIITLPDGRLLSPSVLTHPFKPMKNIIESQIIQDAVDNIRVKVVKNNKYSDNDEKVLLAGFRERVGESLRIEIEYVGSIERTKNGKFKWIISKVKPIF